MGTLTERQFRSLLRRAVAEQSIERPFAEEDLLQAGEELGLERAVVLRILDEHRQRKPADILPKPRGTKIRRWEDQNHDVTIEIPPARAGNGLGLGMMAGTAFGWITLTLWTFMALNRKPVALPFSIPGWIGLVLLSWKAASMWFMRTVLRLSSDGIEIIEGIGPFKARSRFGVDPI